MLPDDQDSDGIIYKFMQLKEESKKISSSLLDSNIELKKQIVMLTSFRNRVIVN